MRTTKRKTPELPGILGTARTDRRTDALVPRLRAGDVAVIDHPDLDRATARRLAERSPAAVVNLSPFLTGRRPARGAATLLAAGITVVERLEADLHELHDGKAVRLHDGVLHVGEREFKGIEVSADELGERERAAHKQLAAQLLTVTHNAAELLRGEQELLLHDVGLPHLAAAVRDRDVLVVADGPDLADELRGLRAWLRHQDVTVMAVGRVADLLAEQGIRAHVVVLLEGELPSARVLRAAQDVVVVGASSAPQREALERLGVAPRALTTTIAAPDAAVVLAAAGGARLVVTAGQHADLADLLDRRDAAASALVARLRSGPQLVDARVLPHLWSGTVRAWHLWLVLLAGAVAVLVAIATTPAGQDWLAPHFHDLTDSIRGLFQR